MTIIPFMDNLRSFANRLTGMSFNGMRDLYKTFGYYDNVDYAMMLAAYTRQDVVSRIVHAYPDAIWVRPPEILDNMELANSFDTVSSNVNLYHYINRAEKLAGIGKYSVLMLGFDDANDVKDLAKPVSSYKSKVKLLYVQVYGYGDAKVKTYVTKPNDPRFGMPEIYTLRLESLTGANNAVGGAMDVHHERIIHITENQLVSDVIGVPIIERVYNRLCDLEKIIGGASEMFFQNGRMGLHIDLDKDVKIDGEGEAALEAEVADYLHNLQRVIRTSGATVKNIGGSTINPGPVFNVIMSVISVTTGIPQRIFIGSEQGKLASEQDRANWALRVNERRILQEQPRVLYPIVDRLQKYGVIAKGEYNVEWPDAFQMSPLERAQTAAQQARSATNIASTLTKQPFLLSTSEARNIIHARGELRRRSEDAVAE